MWLNQLWTSVVNDTIFQCKTFCDLTACTLKKSGTLGASVSDSLLTEVQPVTEIKKSMVSHYLPSPLLSFWQFITL